MNSRLIIVFAFTLSTFMLAPRTAAEDWPQWRGPNRDAKSTETGLRDQWPEDGPPLAWVAEGLGGGYSSVSVAGGKVFTLGDLEDGSYAIAMNESDGAFLWKTRIGDSGGHRKYPGTRSTPTVDGDHLFVLNQYGDLVCLTVKDGERVWQVNLQENFGGQMMSGWRYSESPLVDGNRVVVTPGGNQGTVLALDRETGDKIWQSGDWTDPAGYSSVIIKTIHGKRQYVQLTGRHVGGIDPETGEVLWLAERDGRTAVVATPVVHDDIVFVTSSYGVGCNGFQISRDGDTWTTEELYANTNIANHHGGVVLLDGYVYGSSGGTFRCLDITTGELSFGERSVGKGATVYADGHLILRSESGPVALIKATPDSLQEVSRFEQPRRSSERAWPHPVVANGKLYLRDQDILLVYDLR